MHRIDGHRPDTDPVGFVAGLERPVLIEVPRLLRLLAAQTANLFVPANLGDRLSLDHRTVDRYASLLELTYLVKRIPAWRPGLGQREVQHPKAHVVDSGLLLHLLGADEERLLAATS